MIPFIKAITIPMGNSLFMTWPQIDEMFAQFASTYFGPHARGAGDRDENDCYFEVSRLNSDDFDKFSKLFSRYDKDGDFDPREEFCIGPGTYVTLPVCITRGILSEILPKEFGLKIVGTLQAMHEGVFLMENELDYNQFVIGRSAMATPAHSEPAERCFEIFVEDPHGQFDYSIFVEGALNHDDAVEKAAEEGRFQEPEHVQYIDAVAEISRDEFLAATRALAEAKPALSNQIQSAAQRAGTIRSTNPVSKKEIDPEH